MSNRKLLLADDSVTIQKVINLTFADEGIEVMAVGDGDTAMERFYDFRPDIVLADVNMPGMNGYRICEHLRQHEDSAHIPVMLLVGSFESFDENEARRVGANDWMTKPFQSIRQLVGKVTSLLEHPEDSNHAAVETPTPQFEESPQSLDTQPLTEPVKENEDIDDLYTQSFAKTVELPESYRSDLVLGDSGMDDDMIETSHVAPATQNAEIRDFEIEPVEPQYDLAETLPDVQADAFEIPADESIPDQDTLPVLEFRAPDLEERPKTGVETQEYEFSFDPTAEQIDNEKGFDIQPEPEPEPALEPEIVAAAVDFEPMAQPAIDEAEPLEIPATVDSPKFHEAVEDIVTFDDEPRSQNMSPEFIDAVARKVIEKISENVIRQIAWQVVPQVAESVIREKIAEAKLDR